MLKDRRVGALGILLATIAIGTSACGAVSADVYAREACELVESTSGPGLQQVSPHKREAALLKARGDAESAVSQQGIFRSLSIGVEDLVQYERKRSFGPDPYYPSDHYGMVLAACESVGLKP